MGSPAACIFAVVTVVVWAVAKPLFKSTDSWMLIINTLTTIITYLMVFIIQNSQNRDIRAIHIKLDELIRVGEGRNLLAAAEELPDEEIKKLSNEFRNLDKEVEVAAEKVGEKVGQVHEAVKEVHGEVRSLNGQNKP
jgi:low affinity Fe/Cu permease